MRYSSLQFVAQALAWHQTLKWCTLLMIKSYITVRGVACHDKAIHMGVPRLPSATLTPDTDAESASDVRDPSLTTSLPLLEMLSIFILLMMDILLKVPRLRLMLVAFKRFISTGKLCLSWPASNTLLLMVSTCTAEDVCQLNLHGLLSH